MKITIITGRIFPAISARAFRSTELAKGLSKLGHDVTVYALLDEYDYSEFEKNTGVKVLNLGTSHFINAKGFWGVLNKVIFKLRFMSLLFDYPRIEYATLTMQTLKKMTECDLLITIAHPYGIHFGTAWYNKKRPHQKYKLWISDCGDPFMGDPDIRRIPLFLKRWEKQWGDQTDIITIPVEKSRTGYYHEVQSKIQVIPQSIDFDSVTIGDYVPNPIPTFLYCGAVYPGMRDPSQLLEYLCGVENDFRFIVYSSSKIFDSYKERLGKKLDIRDRIPRLELIRIQSTMDFLLNLKNDSVIQTPSKLIDYALAKRPILEVSTTMSYEEKKNLNDFLRGDYTHQQTVKDIEQFDNKNVAKRFVQLYEDYVEKK